MSLETVLKIGKALRESEDSLKNFKYVKPCPKDKDNKYLKNCVSVPVTEDFKLDWNGIRVIPESQKDSLFYMTFKTSDGDSSVKYMFGDIYYGTTATMKKSGGIEKKEVGFYKLGDPDGRAAQQKNSFERGQKNFEELLKEYKEGPLIEFRKMFGENAEIIEKVLSNISAVEEFLFESLDLSFVDFIKNDEAVDDAAIRRTCKNATTQTLKKLSIESDFGEWNEEERETLLEFANGEMFLHFEFPEGLHWYQYQTEFDLLAKKMLDDFVETSENGIVLKKTLYKTLCSGDLKNDWQFPEFTPVNKHKSKNFDDAEIRDLFYAIDYCSRGRTIMGTEIKIIVLPRGENLKAADYESFVTDKNEIRIKNSNQEENESEPIFDIFAEEKNVVTSFDVIFTKKGGTSTPDVDLIEISGIESSKIQTTRNRINEISRKLAAERKAYLRTKKDLFPFKIEHSFKNILGNPQYNQKAGKVEMKTNPRYESHLLKVLPLIYTNNYFQDDILLPAFIRNIEFSIRSGDEKFNLLKFDFEFLMNIQDSQNDSFMEIKNSESYKIGVLLGSLAQQLKSEINSFEKNYVGNLSRRISTIDDFIKLKNDIEQKLIMHGKTKFTSKNSYELAQDVKSFSGRYDKEEVCFGFLESYFKPFPKKKKEEA
jgi:hypothetical protein